jgi:hypothetical protein
MKTAAAARIDFESLLRQVFFSSLVGWLEWRHKYDLILLSLPWYRIAAAACYERIKCLGDEIGFSSFFSLF